MGCRGSYAALFASLLAVAGCERRAPGPEACGDLALRWVSRPAAQVVVRRHGDDQILRGTVAEVEELARLCVTTPFDREVIRCAEGGGAPELCLRAFEDRRRRAGAPGLRADGT